MQTSLRRALLSLLPLTLLLLRPTALAQPASDLRHSFAEPPADARIMMRWWWFGPAVTQPEIQRELEQMKAAGIGGVEIATLYPQSLDDPAAGIHNGRYLSESYIRDLRFAAQQARRLGMRVDITLGSGWPLGGPAIPVTLAAGGLRVVPVPIAPGVTSVAIPAMEPGEAYLSAFLIPENPVDLNPHTDLRAAKPAPAPHGGRLTLSESARPRTAIFFFSSRTGMMVKRPAIGAEGFVLDHYSAAAIDAHLQAVGDRLLQAFGPHPPYAVFSDSLEDYGSDWTPGLLAQFRIRRGYDLAPYLPALVGDIGPDTAAIRHDWGRTLTELADENFLAPMHAWARAHGTLLRSQTYGYPPVTLSSNRYEDLPEGEGKATIAMARQFSDTRWAASAGHLFGSNIVSSETWTWIHNAAFRATPLDLKAEADLHFLQGINQLVGHGWPYSPPSAAEPGWRMYAAGALNAHNPWFFAMPDLAAYLQRVSFALRLGHPDNDVALLLPDDDVWAAFHARYPNHASPASLGGFDESGSNVSIDENMQSFLGPHVIPQILDAGFNLDFVDADAIDRLGIPYKVLILPGIDRLPIVTYRKIAEFARRGGLVIATRRLPATAPGLLDAAAETRQIQSLSQSLFHGSVASARFEPEETRLGAALRQSLAPDFLTTPATPAIGFLHRRLESADLYFIANTSNRPQAFTAHFRAAHRYAELWDAFTGRTQGLAQPQDIPFTLAPYASRLVYLSDTPPVVPPVPASRQIRIMDLSRGWQLVFPDAGHAPLPLPALVSWSGLPGRRFYSGTASYRRTLTLTAADLRHGHTLLLTFGEGTPLPLPDPAKTPNMHAYLESPVLDAAKVFINGQQAGFVWHPPFTLDVTPFLRQGVNQVRILVGNTAINCLGGQAPPEHRLLDARYGVRAVPQYMDHLEPLPSGLLGPIALVESGPANSTP